MKEFFIGLGVNVLLTCYVDVFISFILYERQKKPTYETHSTYILIMLLPVLFISCYAMGYFILRVM